MDRRHFFGTMAGNLLAWPLGASAAPVANKARPATPKSTLPLATLAANTARDLGPYANAGFPGSTNITDYSGLALDATGKRLCLFGGGHGPSQETDIRIFDLGTLQWSSLYPPTPWSEMVVANCDRARGRYMSTNQPTARHSYNLTFVRGRRFYMLCFRGMPDHLDGALGVDNGWGGRICWYDFDAATWSYSAIAQQDTPWYFASAAVLDPMSGLVLVAGPNSQAGMGAVWIYDPDHDKIDVAVPNFNPGIAPEFVYFPPNDRFYILQSAGQAFEIWFNRANPRLSTVTPLTVTGTPPTAEMGIVCGYAYDSVNRVIGGNVINGAFHAFDPPARRWTRSPIQFEPGSQGPATQAFHCLDFDPDSGCFVFLQTPTMNQPGSPTTWAYRYANAATPAAATGVSDLDVTLDFGGGAVARFSGASAVDRGDFFGEFVHQKCYLATDPAFPDWRVWFRVDAASDGTRIAEPAAGWRDEIVVEYGRSTHGTPLHILAPYTATIAKAGNTVATYTVPKHWWYARWRHQSSVRPVVRSPATLRARGWIPNFGTEGMYGGGPANVSVAWPGPMGAPARPAPNYPFDPATAAGGDHDEIGFLTEHAASYAIFGEANALTTLRTQGEWCGNWCVHIRDDDTGAPVACRDTKTFFKDAGGAIINGAAGGSGDPAFVAVDGGAHWYACANMPWLLTDDPFFLEELQFGVNFRVLWNRTPRITQGLGGIFYPGETRCMAWGIRDLVQLTASCPNATPSWLRPKSYWKGMLDDNRQFALRYANAPARIHSMFREWTHVNICAAWQSAWLSAACGLAVEAGFSDWKPVFDWSIGKQIAMTNGQSGWNRQWPVPYYTMPNKNPGFYSQYEQYPQPTSIDTTTATSWADYWAYYKSGSDGHSDLTGHVIDDTGWDGHTLMAQFYPAAGYASYFLHLRAALAIAVTRGTQGARQCYDYLHNELLTALPSHYGYTGQARFSIDPRVRSYEGLWWNAPAGSEPGWGIGFAHQGDIIFATWFSYDAAGAPRWLSMAATRTSEDRYDGALYRSSGPPFDSSVFDPQSVATVPVGSGTLTFDDADNATFSYVVAGASQSKAITRMQFSSAVPACALEDAADLAATANHQGIWWAAPSGSESGWGIHLAHQGDTIVATWFTYGADHGATWMSLTAVRASDGVYEGPVYAMTGPAFDSVPFDPAHVVATQVGSATLTFSDGANARFDYTVGAAQASKLMTRFTFAAPPTVCRQ